MVLCVIDRLLVWFCGCDGYVFVGYYFFVVDFYVGVVFFVLIIVGL